jgi:hypothetical protein
MCIYILIKNAKGSLCDEEEYHVYKSNQIEPSIHVCVCYLRNWSICKSDESYNGEGQNQYEIGCWEKKSQHNCGHGYEWLTERIAKIKR